MVSIDEAYIETCSVRKYCWSNRKVRVTLVLSNPTQEFHPPVISPHCRLEHQRRPLRLLVPTVPKRTESAFVPYVLGRRLPSLIVCPPKSRNPSPNAQNFNKQKFNDIPQFKMLAPLQCQLGLLLAYCAL